MAAFQAVMGKQAFVELSVSSSLKPFFNLKSRNKRAHSRSSTNAGFFFFFDVADDDEEEKDDDDDGYSKWRRSVLSRSLALRAPRIPALKAPLSSSRASCDASASLRAILLPLLRWWLLRLLWLPPDDGA